MQFKSQNGTGCLVNIWEEDYTSSAVTSKTGADVPFNTENGVIALTGGANPFTFQEDDSESLTDVFRYKTGYIRAVETSYGQLTDLYPETNTQHYVEMYYGSTLAFVGYMQAQSFDNNWVPSPRGLGFPVMSPLGLAEGIRLNAITTPQRVSLASLLHEAIVGLNGAYDKVIIPDVAHSIEGVVNSLVVSPYNGNFSSSAYSSDPVFEPITYADLIEGICNAFGWIVHDIPDALVFTMFDHFGDYAQYTLANLPTMSGKTIVADGSAVVALGTISQVAGNDGKESTILPYKSININFGGDFNTSASFGFDKMKFVYDSHYSNEHAAWFQPLDGCLQSSHLQIGNLFNTSNGHVSIAGVMPTECGAIGDMMQCILVKVDPSWGYSSAVFTAVFNSPPAKGFMLKFDKRFGNLVNEMKADGDEGVLTHYDLAVKVKSGSKYYQGNGLWGDSAAESPTTSWEVTNVPTHAPIEVEFWLAYYSGTPQAELISVENLELAELESLFSKYKAVTASQGKINGSAGSDEDVSISMLFSYTREGSNMIGDEVYPLPTSYPYLRKAQLRLKAPFKLSVPSYPYCKLIDYWLANKRWRLIAMDFDPWDDKHVLTLHRSPCLDDNASSFSITVAGNVTSDAPSYVQAGAYVQINIFPDDGYDIDYIDVYMGGVNISADAWPGYGNVINIEEVTGVVSIEVHTVAASENIPLTWYNKAINSTQYVSNSTNQVSQEMTFDSSTVKVRVTPGTTKCRYMVYPVFGIALTADDPRADSGWLIAPNVFEFVPDTTTAYVVRIQPYPKQSSSERNALTADDKPTVTRFYKS